MGLTNNTNFCAKTLEGFYSKALLTGKTAANVAVYANVKNSIKIASFDAENMLAAADCSFTDSGSGILADKTLTVCALKVNKEICLTTIEATYLADKLRPGSNTGEVVPPTLEEYILQQYALKINAELEDLFWNGDSEASPSDLCDGIIPLLLADDTVIDADNPAPLTATNIFAELGKVYDALPNAIYDQDVKIFISVEASKFYRQALAGLNGAPFNGYVNDKEMAFYGIPLIVTKAMPANTMVAAVGTNLLWLTDLLSDYEEISLLDMSKTTGAKALRFIAGLKFGANYKVGSEIVLYGSGT